jgi:mannose/fructose/N-acetylgalactosamine-specific phosphotransferase system component IIC
MGVLLGDATAGVMIGVVFELFHLGAASLGGAHADHETIAALTASGFAAAIGAASGADATPAIWAFAILVCAPLGIAGRYVDGWLDTRASRYLVRVADALDDGTIERAVRQNLKAMWPHFAFGFVMPAAASIVGALCARLEDKAPVFLIRGLAWSYPLLGTVAAAAAVHASQGEGRLRIAALVALMVALALLGALGVRTWS